MERFFKKLTVLLSALLIAATVMLIAIIPSYAKSEKKLDLFSANKIAGNIKNMEINMTTVIYVKGKDGEWEEYRRLHGSENRLWVGIDKMPEQLGNAFIAIEDETFFDNKGVNWKRTLGAVANKLFKFDDTEFGGSTITQQLIKNVTNDKDRDITRKVREIARALLISRKLTKTEILEAYLNTISLGNGICGVQVAANYYFNKDAADLTLTECAALAAITKNPSKYNPVTEKGAEENKARRRTVLDKMLELEMISYEEYDEAYNTELKLDDSQKDEYESEINNYFVDALIDQVIDDLAEKYALDTDMASTLFYNGGFKIYSTLDTAIQTEVEKVYTNVNTYFPQTVTTDDGEKVHVQSAMTIMDYSGHIVATVGGAGEKTTNRGLNRAFDSPRQPGSTMKPIGVYALAIEKDIVHYTSQVLDKPIENYTADGKSGPREWYGYYKGTVSLNYAIRKSMNTVPVRLLQELGIDASYDFLVNKLHCKHLTETDKNLAALALGGTSYGITATESAAAYAIFGNGGVYHKPTTYYEIKQANGETVIKYDDTGEQVIGADTATIMNHLLQEVVYGSEGTGGGIAGFNYKLKAYAKTGTSNDSNDLWIVAGTPYYVGSVWYGFDRSHNINNASAAAKIWRDVMKEVHKGLDKKEFEDSADVVKKGIGYYKKDTEITNPLYYSSSSSSASSATSSQTESASSAVSSTESSSSVAASSSESTPAESEAPPSTDSGNDDTSAEPTPPATDPPTEEQG